MAKLAVIVPYVNEFPQILFTIRAIHEELADIDHMIYAVDNYVDGAYELESHPRDPGHDNGFGPKGQQTDTIVKTMAGKWYQYMRFDKVVSHWQAKDYAVSNTTEPYLLFLDAHIIPGRHSISDAFLHYELNYEYLHGTMGMPLTYHILENHILEYKFVPQMEKWFLGYSFTTHTPSQTAREVPCHSMCGCFMGRDIYNAFGGWGKGFGPYGGGENLMNFVLPTIGYKHWMWGGEPVYHHGYERGYRANQYQIITNRAIAAYLYGNDKWLRNYLTCGNLPPLHQIKMENYIKNIYQSQQQAIRGKQVMEIEEWISKHTS